MIGEAMKLQTNTRLPTLLLVTGALLVGVGCFSGTSAALLADDLWSGAVTLYRANTQIEPQTMSISYREIDGSGTVRNDEFTRLRINYPADGGKPAGEVIQATKNGKDVTDERRKDPQPGRSAGVGMLNGADQQEASSAFASLFISPFDPGFQDGISVTPTGETRSVGSRIEDKYLFTQKTGGKYSNSGSVWIDSLSGTPVSATLTVSPLPPFVQSITERIDYATSNGMWFVSKVSLDGALRILFYYRRYSADLSFAEYAPHRIVISPSAGAEPAK